MFIYYAFNFIFYSVDDQHKIIKFYTAGGRLDTDLERDHDDFQKKREEYREALMNPGKKRF